MTVAMSSTLFLLVACSSFSTSTANTVATLLGSGNVLLNQDKFDDSFNEFKVKHGRDYKHGDEEHEMRKALFRDRLAEVQAHNANPGNLWKKGISHFSDRTEAERKAVLGYKRHMSLARHAGTSLLQMDSPMTSMPESKDWKHLKVAGQLRDQGFCGSCWAFTTVAVLEAHYEIHGGKARTFSPQQLVSCTPNPHACGGTGGCSGATVELGMDWIKKNGLASEDQVPYHAEDGHCFLTQHQDGSGTKSDRKEASPKQELAKTGSQAMGMVGYHTLPQNQERPLAEAVVKYGPVGVAVAADAWFEYNSGIFGAGKDDGCSPNAVLNHAVTLYGFGKEDGHKYWLIRNSYGSNWGEQGFIRMKRFGKERAHCGNDTDPGEGVACKGGPSEVEICGMCGVLYDAVIPYFKNSPAPHLPGEPEPSANNQAAGVGVSTDLHEDQGKHNHKHHSHHEGKHKHHSHHGESLIRVEAKAH